MQAPPLPSMGGGWAAAPQMTDFGGSPQRPVDNHAPDNYRFGRTPAEDAARGVAGPVLGQNVVGTGTGVETQDIRQHAGYSPVRGGPENTVEYRGVRQSLTPDELAKNNAPSNQTLADQKTWTENRSREAAAKGPAGGSDNATKRVGATDVNGQVKDADGTIIPYGKGGQEYHAKTAATMVQSAIDDTKPEWMDQKPFTSGAKAAAAIVKSPEFEKMITGVAIGRGATATSMREIEADINEMFMRGALAADLHGMDSNGSQDGTFQNDLKLAVTKAAMAYLDKNKEWMDQLPKTAFMKPKAAVK